MLPRCGICGKAGNHDGEDRYFTPACVYAVPPENCDCGGYHAPKKLSRREREKAWIKAERNGYERIKNALGEKRPLLHLLSDALEAAHAREDAIRKLRRFNVDMDCQVERSEDGDLVYFDDVLAILDGDEVKP